jgi:glycosyltransferase involved in cell wall biosynthesis
MIPSDTAAIITTHNGARRGYTLCAIDSVLSQTVPPDEIVVVDDASTDGTVEAIKLRFADAVRIINLPANVGPSGARNQGVCATSAPLVAFLDDDDEWLPDKLEVQRRFIEETSASLVFSHAMLVDSAGRSVSARRPVYPEACSWPGIVFRNPVQGPSSVLVRRETFLAAGGFPEGFRIGEDWVLWARIAQIGKIAYTEKALIRYRIHGQQAAAGHDVAWIRERTLEALKALAEPLPPAQRALLLNSYAYGGALRALAARDLGATLRLAMPESGCPDWRLLLCKAVQGSIAQLAPFLAESMDRLELRRLVRRFEYLGSQCARR